MVKIMVRRIYELGRIIKEKNDTIDKLDNLIKLREEEILLADERIKELEDEVETMNDLSDITKALDDVEHNM